VPLGRDTKAPRLWESRTGAPFTWTWFPAIEDEEIQRNNRASSSRIRSSPCRVKIFATVAMVSAKIVERRVESAKLG
jgi:hypothetical protein